MIKINEQFCPKNHTCPVIKACPLKAISQKDIFSAPEIDYNKCTDCGLCTNYCRVFKKE